MWIVLDPYSKIFLMNKYRKKMSWERIPRTSRGRLKSLSKLSDIISQKGYKSPSQGGDAVKQQQSKIDDCLANRL